MSPPCYLDTSNLDVICFEFSRKLLFSISDAEWIRSRNMNNLFWWRSSANKLANIHHKFLMEFSNHQEFQFDFVSWGNMGLIIFSKNIVQQASPVKVEILWPWPNFGKFVLTPIGQKYFDISRWIRLYINYSLVVRAQLTYCWTTTSQLLRKQFAKLLWFSKWLDFGTSC